MMVSTYPMCCTCSECVFRRWFLMDSHNAIDCSEKLPQTFGRSWHKNIWSVDEDIGPLPQAALWTPPTPEASPPPPEAPQAPELPPGNELFTPRATSTPLETNPPGTQSVSEGALGCSIMNAGFDFPDIPVKNPSKSAKRQKRKRSDLVGEAPAPSNRLHVSNIPFWFTHVDLIGLFKKCGHPRQAEIIYNERGSKGFGFVTFASVEEATIIRQAFDKKEVHGRVIEVNYASKRSSRRSKFQLQQTPYDTDTGFVQLELDPKHNGCKMDKENICVKHKTSGGRSAKKKFNGRSQQMNYERSRADQKSRADGQIGPKSQSPFWMGSSPSDNSLLDFLVRKGQNTANQGQNLLRGPRTGFNSNQGTEGVHRCGQKPHFDVENNVNSSRLRRFDREIIPPYRTASQRMATGNRSGLMEHHKPPSASSRLQRELVQQDMEFSKMSQVQARVPPIADPIYVRNINVSGLESWFFDLNFSLRASLEKQRP